MHLKMKFKFLSIFFIIFVLQSCQNQNQKRQIDSSKDTKKKEIVFATIEKSWLFEAKPTNETSRNTTKNWADWRLFLTELDKKPKKSIEAFQKKATELVKKANALNNTIPIEFDKPSIKARIAILITKISLLELYIKLKDIPEKKVIALFPEINIHLLALQHQMDKLVIKSKIPLEEGESELRKMLDSSRAIPDQEPDPNYRSIE